MKQLPKEVFIKWNGGDGEENRSWLTASETLDSAVDEYGEEWESIGVYELREIKRARKIVVTE